MIVVAIGHNQLTLIPKSKTVWQTKVANFTTKALHKISVKIKDLDTAVSRITQNYFTSLNQRLVPLVDETAQPLSWSTNLLKKDTITIEDLKTVVKRVRHNKPSMIKHCLGWASKPVFSSGAKFKA